MKEVLPFSPERVRMSVIVRDPSNRLTLLAKGSDVQIMPRCKSMELIPEQTHRRTLVYATRGLTEAEL